MFENEYNETFKMGGVRESRSCFPMLDGPSGNIQGIPDFLLGDAYFLPKPNKHQTKAIVCYFILAMTTHMGDGLGGF
jgi:hypothetical protein